VNTGPSRKRNSFVVRSSTEAPVMSEGIRSGVNWTRWNRRPSSDARVRTSVVLPTPGTSSIRTCESVRMPARTRRSGSRTPNSRSSTRAATAS
jgi:hypothetical protein